MGRSLPQLKTEVSICASAPLGWSDCPVETGRIYITTLTPIADSNLKFYWALDCELATLPRLL